MTLPDGWHTIGGECRDPYCEHEVLEGHHHGPTVAVRTTPCDQLGCNGTGTVSRALNGEADFGPRMPCPACGGRGFLWPEGITVDSALGVKETGVDCPHDGALPCACDDDMRYR